MTTRSPRWTAAIVGAALAAGALSVTGSPAAAQQHEERFHRASTDGVDGSYIVRFTDEPGKSSSRSAVEQTATTLLAEYPAAVQQVYHHTFAGAAVRVPERVARQLARHPRVAYVQQETRVKLAGEQHNPVWSLDRLDRRGALDGVYRWDTDGTGVHAYVVDSGIRRTHQDFGGRVLSTVTFGQPGTGPAGSHDCLGHGTNMASAIGGQTYGVAKNVWLHSIRFTCSGLFGASAVVAALDWLAANAQRPAVVNLSLTTGPNVALDEAVRALIRRGITVVAAAGNDNMDACGYSPARVPDVITVGGTHFARDRVEFSNWGPCVDVFAPAEQITAAGFSTDTATQRADGTSVATAYVTGTAARLLQRFPTASPALVWSKLADEAIRDGMRDPRGASNLQLYVDPNGPGNDGFTRSGTDVNGDGRDDIVTFLRGGLGHVWVSLSTGSGFAPSHRWHTNFAGGDAIPLLGDVNGDGRDDLIMFNREGQVRVALSTGSSFGPSQVWHQHFSYDNQTPLVGDFNGDGRDDIATITKGAFGSTSPRSVYVALSNGSAFVGTAVRWNDAFTGGDAIALVGDVDCDGRDDLVAYERAGSLRAFALISQGNRFAAPAPWHYRVAAEATVPALADVTGDGCADLVGFFRGDNPQVWVAPSMVRSLGYRHFGDWQHWHSNFAAGVQVPGLGDFTGDGRADAIAFARGTSGRVYVVPSTGWAFSAQVQTWHHWFAPGLEVPMPSSMW